MKEQILDIHGTANHSDVGTCAGPPRRKNGPPNPFSANLPLFNLDIFDNTPLL